MCGARIGHRTFFPFLVRNRPGYTHRIQVTSTVDFGFDIDVHAHAHAHDNK